MNNGCNVVQNNGGGGWYYSNIPSEYSRINTLVCQQIYIVL